MRERGISIPFAHEWPKSTLELAAETSGEPLFGASNGPTGDPTPVTFLSDPDMLATLKTELHKKPLQIAVFCGALGRTRTCGLLIRSQPRMSSADRHPPS